MVIRREHAEIVIIEQRKNIPGIHLNWRERNISSEIRYQFDGVRLVANIKLIKRIKAKEEGMTIIETVNRFFRIIPITALNAFCHEALPNERRIIIS